MITTKSYYGVFQKKSKDKEGNTIVKEYVEFVEGKYPLDAKIQLQETARLNDWKLQNVYAEKKNR